MNVKNRRRTAIVAVVATAAAVFAAVAPVTATAAGGEGWLRLGHFSPDTNKVDVRVTALRGGSVALDLENIGYGDISSYAELDAGTYTVAMVGAGTEAWSTPVISAEITVGAGTAGTVAAYGPNSGLKVQAFSDDLTAPASGSARIRVIQASTVTPSVSVSTSDGTSVARDVRSGTASGYVAVPAGTWNLRLIGGDVTDTASVDVAAGSVTTLFVLDTAERGLTILPVTDSAASAVVPNGGVATGGGWLATRTASVLDLGAPALSHTGLLADVR